MSFTIRTLRNTTTALLLSVSALFAHAAPLLNGDFESSNTNEGWTYTPVTASVSNLTPISGSQSLLLDNTLMGVGSFAVAFQTIALDGSDFLVGDTIFLSGLSQFLSTQGNQSRVFVELAFRNGGTDDVVGQIGDIDFAGSVFAELSVQNGTVQMFSTANIVIPDIITSLNGVTAQTTGIRIGLALGALQAGDDLTQVLIDDVRLQKVALASTPSIILLVGLFLSLMLTRAKIVKT